MLPISGQLNLVKLKKIDSQFANDTKEEEEIRKLNNSHIIFNKYSIISCNSSHQSKQQHQQYLRRWPHLFALHLLDSRVPMKHLHSVLWDAPSYLLHSSENSRWTTGDYQIGLTLSYWMIQHISHSPDHWVCLGYSGCIKGVILDNAAHLSFFGSLGVFGIFGLYQRCHTK